MNKALFISTFQRTYRLFTIFLALILFYLIVIMGMYSTSLESDPFAMLPEGMRNAFGFDEGMNGLTGFVATGFYGVTFVVFMMILCILAANQLMAHYIDRGSMAYLLSTPVSRGKIAMTQAMMLVTALLMMMLVTTITGIILAPLMDSGTNFSYSSFIQINIVGFFLFFVISGYSFLFSSLFNDAKHSLAASGTISVVFYMIHLMGNMRDDLGWLDYLTILSLFQPGDIVAGTASVLFNAITLGIAGMLLYGSAIYVFIRRDLPL